MNKKFFLFIILFSIIFGNGYGAVSIIIKNHTAPNGSQLTVPVRVKDFVDIISAQGTLQFDPTIATFASVQDFGLPGMTAANFGTILTSSGKLTFSWSDNGLIGRTLADSAVLFSVRFNIIGTTGQQTTLALTSSPTAIELVNTSYQTVATTMVNGSILVNNTSTSGTITLYADTASGVTGSQASVSVRAINFTNINSLQGTIQFDPAVVTYQSISYFGLSGMSAANFGVTQIASGKLTYSWSDQTLAGLDKANGSPIFTILFTLNGSSGSQSNISFVNSPTTIEISDSLNAILTPTLIIGKVNITGSTSSQFSIKGDSTSGPNGSQVLVPIRAWKFNQILSMQGTLQFNSSVVTYVGVEQFGLTGFDTTNFGTTQISSGKLMYSWADATLAGITKSDSSVLFAVRFNIIGTASQFSSIDFINSPTALECTDISYAPIATNYHSGNINVTGPTSIITQDPTLLSYCSGDGITVSYTKSGIFNSSNDFILQLSSATGSFVSPTNLATIHTVNSGTFITTIPAATANGTLYRLRVISTNPAINGSTNVSNITISTLPGQAVKPSGNIVICQNAANTTYTTTGATNATSYQWTIWPLTAGTITGTTTSADVDWNAAFSGIAYIKVTGKNNSCNGLTSDSLAIIVNINPLAPAKPIGDTLLCTNSANSTYSISAVTNATSYAWSIAPVGAGSITGTITSAIVNWNDTYTGVASIQVTASNGICLGTASSIRSVTILATPSTPTIPSGLTSVCQDAVDAIYKITRVANAISYTWSISPISAGTISGTDTAATVNWNSTYSGTAFISVSAQNQICASIASPSLSVNVLAYPITPTVPSGIADLCVNPANTTYTITSVPNATSYTWAISPIAAGTLTPSGTSVIVDWSNTWTGNATISVIASNGSCASSASPNLSVIVRELPLAPSQPTGTILLCQDAPSNSYSTSTVANVTSYEWEITPSTAGTLSGTGTTVSIDWSASYSGTATLHVRGVNGTCAGVWSTNLSIDVLPIPTQAAIPTGITDLCQDATNTTYTTAGATNATSYQWTIYPLTAGTITGTTTSAIVDWSATYSGTAYIKVLGKSGSCNGNYSDSLAVLVRAYPLTPAKPIGDTLLCTNSANSTYSITSVVNATSYTWSITPVGAGTITGTTTSAIVNWNDTYTGVASIQVTASNGICVGASSPIRSVTILATPSAPSIPSGLTSVCQDAVDAIYKITRVANATSYTWSLSPISAGTISGTDTAATVNWNSTYSGTAFISVSAQNQICASIASPSLSVNVLAYPITPTVPSGTADLCVNPANTTYTITSVPNATSYTWAISPIAAGTLTPSGTSTVVDWSNTWTGNATISVIASNGSCASSASPNLTVIVRELPLAPSQPTGTILLCQDAPSNSYSTSTVANVTSYEWEITPSTAGTLSGTGTTVSIDWSASYSGTATLHVRGLNGLCSGDWSNDLSIVVTPKPSQPLKPIGDSILCVNNTNSNYYTHPVENGESFVWQLIPSIAGTIISSDTSLIIDWDNAWVGIAKIAVVAQNSCGSSISSDTVNITINDVPAVLSTPTGLTDICQNVISTDCAVTTGINTNSYEWIINPSTAGSISSISATNSQITWITGWSGTAYVSVRGLNNCGIGQWSDSLIIVRHPNVPTPIITQIGNTLYSSASSGNQWFFNGGILNGQTNTTYIFTQNGSYTVQVTDQYGCTSTSASYIVDNVSILENELNNQISIAPNPSNGHFKIHFANQKDNFTLEIYNTLGKIVYSQNIEKDNQNLTLDLNLPQGIYYLTRSDNKSSVKKIIIEK